MRDDSLEITKTILGLTKGTFLCQSHSLTITSSGTIAMSLRKFLIRLSICQCCLLPLLLYNFHENSYLFNLFV